MGDVYINNPNGLPESPYLQEVAEKAAALVQESWTHPAFAPTELAVKMHLDQRMYPLAEDWDPTDPKAQIASEIKGLFNKIDPDLHDRLEAAVIKITVEKMSEPKPPPIDPIREEREELEKLFRSLKLPFTHPSSHLDRKETALIQTAEAALNYYHPHNQRAYNIGAAIIERRINTAQAAVARILETTDLQTTTEPKLIEKINEELALRSIIARKEEIQKMIKDALETKRKKKRKKPRRQTKGPRRSNKKSHRSQ
jgi:hypothetical protein